MALIVTIYPDRVARVLPRPGEDPAAGPRPVPVGSRVTIRWAVSRLAKLREPGHDGPCRPRGTTCGIEAVRGTWDIIHDTPADSWQRPNHYECREVGLSASYVLVFTALRPDPGGIVLRHRRTFTPGEQGLLVEFDPAGFHMTPQLAADVPSERNAPKGPPGVRPVRSIGRAPGTNRDHSTRPNPSGGPSTRHFRL